MALRQASRLLTRRPAALPAVSAFSRGLTRGGLRAALHRPSPTVQGHDHHGPVTYDPPYHRLPLPSKPLHEEDELVWNDGVAPETALDFDAPHMSKWEGLAWWLGGFAFFYAMYQFARATDHPSNKKSADRVVPAEVASTALGGFGKT